MSNRPEWQLHSLRRIQLRIMLLLIGAYVVTIAVGWLFHILDKQPISGGLIAATHTPCFDLRSQHGVFSGSGRWTDTSKT